jgi:D-threo-aldose 1-dehydrogenase
VRDVALGATGVHVSALGIGTAVLPPRPAGDPGFDDRAASEVIDAATAAGCRHVDTADGYYLGASEALLGKVLEGRRDVAVTTKVGWNFYNRGVDEHTKAEARRRLGLDLDALPADVPLPFDHGQDFTAGYLRFAAMRSLDRLRRERADILLLHVPGHEVLRSTTWFRTLRELKDAGLCRAHGVSVRHPFEVIAALANGPPDVVQVPVLPTLSRPMALALDAARSKGVGVIGREVFGGGKLIRALQGALPQLPVATMCRAVIDAVLANDRVDAVVVGCSNVTQVADDFTAPPASAEESDLVLSAIRALTAGRPPQPYAHIGRADIERFV